MPAVIRLRHNHLYVYGPSSCMPVEGVAQPRSWVCQFWKVPKTAFPCSSASQLRRAGASAMQSEPKPKPKPKPWCLVCLSMAGLMRGLTVRIEHDTKLSAVISSVNLWAVMEQSDFETKKIMILYYWRLVSDAQRCKDSIRDIP